MTLVTARLRALLVVFFDELWRLVPAEPVFFPFYLLGGLAAAIIAPAAIPHVALWSALAMVAPLLTAISWWAIFYRHGYVRYLGFWVRTAGDLLQSIVFGVALLAYIELLPIFLSIIFMAIISFSFVLVTRDFLALWLIEDVASKLHREVHEDAAVG
jgi:hypothetical protein